MRFHAKAPLDREKQELGCVDRFKDIPGQRHGRKWLRLSFHDQLLLLDISLVVLLDALDGHV